MTMMKAIFLSLVVFWVGCGENPKEQEGAARRFFSTIENAPLVVIHHDRAGNLLHYLALEEISGDLLIRVTPSTDDQDLYVTVLGKNRNALLKRSFSMSSQVGEAYLGKVEVIIEKGMAVSLDGNGMHSPALVSDETLQKVEENLAQGVRLSGGENTISLIQDLVE